MKKLYCGILPLVILCATAGKAQTILNGSLEPAGTVTTCSDAPKASFNANMGNVWEAGEVTTIYQANASCNLGAAADGNSFTVLKYRVPLGNLLTFKLSGPLTVNQPYKLALKYRTIAGSTNLGGFRCGYSKDSASFDSSIGYRGGIVNTVWTPDTLAFTPKKAWNILWIEVITLQGSPFDLYIDDLKLLQASQGIDEVSTAGKMSLYPNPARNTTSLTVDETVQLPCRLQLMDITGKQLLQQDLNTSTTTLQTGTLAPGMYLLRMTTNSGQVYTAKMVRE